MTEWLGFAGILVLCFVRIISVAWVRLKAWIYDCFVTKLYDVFLYIMTVL